MPGSSKHQPLRAAGNTGGSGPDNFYNEPFGHGVDKGVQLWRRPGEFDYEADVGDIDDLGAEDVYQALELLPVRLFGPDLDQHQLPLDMGSLGEVEQLDGVDELVELFLDLLHDRFVSGRDQGHARQGRVVRGRHREGFDVVTTGGKQTRDSGQGAGLVLQQDGDDVSHMRDLMSGAISIQRTASAR